MQTYISTLLIAAVLIYGGIVDFRRREIPNIVPIVLLIMGLFDFSMIWSMLGLVIPAAIMFMSAKLTKGEIPGGDFKLICTLGFACGLPELAATLFLSCIGAIAYGFFRNLPLKRQIPLCSYIAPAYLSLHIIAFALEGGGSV